MTEHEVLPTHAFSTTARLVAALHEPSEKSGQLPCGVPKLAKSMAVIVDLSGHCSCSAVFSATMPHDTGPDGGCGGVGTGQMRSTVMTSVTCMGGCMRGCRLESWSAVGGAATLGAQPAPGTNPAVSQPTGSARASMYSTKPLPAEPPPPELGPGLRCTSPLKACQVPSETTTICAPEARVAISWKIVVGGLFIVCNASTCVPAAASAGVTSSV